MYGVSAAVYIAKRNQITHGMFCEVGYEKTASEKRVSFLQHQKGFTLVEAVICIAIMGLVFAGSLLPMCTLY